MELLEFAKFNTVITVVDSMTKIKYFILTYTTVTVKDVIKLFLHYVQKLHSLSIYVVLD